MPNILDFNPSQYLGFIFIFARLLGVFVSAPLLGDYNIPFQIKVGFAFITSLVFFPLLTIPRFGPNPDVVHIVLLMLAELGIGIMLGLTARMILAAVGMAGETIGFQMGIGMANVFDPSTSQQTALVAQVQIVFALLLLVVMDGHHLFIRAVAQSYQLVQPGAFSLERFQYDHLLSITSQFFVLALKLGAPLIVALLAANLGIGLIARTVPQMNVFVVGLPFTIALGLLLLALGFPFFIEAVASLHNQMQEFLLSGFKNG